MNNKVTIKKFLSDKTAITGNGTDALAQSWLFIVAPILGAVIAGLVFKFLNTTKEKNKKK